VWFNETYLKIMPEFSWYDQFKHAERGRHSKLISVITVWYLTCF